MLRVMIVAAAVVGALSAATAEGPTDAQRQALRAHCAADYRANCASVPPGGMASLVCLEQHEAALSPACRSAVDAVAAPPAPPATASPAAAAPVPAPAPTTGPTDAPDTASAAPTATAAPPTPQTLAAPPKRKPQAPLSLRAEMRLAASACFADFSRLCPNIPVGRGNVVRCLRTHTAALSATCRTALERQRQ